MASPSPDWIQRLAIKEFRDRSSRLSSGGAHLKALDEGVLVALKLTGYSFPRDFIVQFSRHANKALARILS